LPPEAVDRLFIEPVVAAQFAESGARIIDIGSGGGSPAIPFALAAKGTFLAMVESRSRKSVFLQEAARVVALPAKVITDRYEEAIRQPELQMAFDVVTIRAVRVDEAGLKTPRRVYEFNGSLFLFQTSELSPHTRDEDRGTPTHRQRNASGGGPAEQCSTWNGNNIVD
jgi:16S rRNA G527 N7-methylase RsmG